MSYDYDRRTASRPQINKPSDGENGYIASFNGKQAEVWADTKLQALRLAQAYFKPAKSKMHLVYVDLAELKGKPYVHTPDF